MQKLTQEHKTTIAAIVLLIIYSSMMFIGGYGYGESRANEVPASVDTYILLDQYIGTLDQDITHSVSTDYLIMECQHISTDSISPFKLYFVKEHELREDLHDNDLIVVTWKYDSLGHKVIRGVERAEEQVRWIF